MGDHKNNIWELSRHQHLVLVAQAFTLTGDARYSQFAIGQIRSWLAENPFQCGINWASSLEVAFRALSWVWIFHLLGSEMDAAFKTEFPTGFPIATGCTWNTISRSTFRPIRTCWARRWPCTRLGGCFRNSNDRRSGAGRGGAFSWRNSGNRFMPTAGTSSSRLSYHVYTTDMFLFHHTLGAAAGARAAGGDGGVSSGGRSGRMGRFPSSGTTMAGVCSIRLFGPRNGFARATLATCSVLLGREYFRYNESDLMEQALWWVGPRAMTTKPAPLVSAKSRCFPCNRAL